MVLKHQVNIGKVGTVQADGLSIEVRILDVKESYGHVRWLVTPVAGSGQRWTETVHLAPAA